MDTALECLLHFEPADVYSDVILPLDSVLIYL